MSHTTPGGPHSHSHSHSHPPAPSSGVSQFNVYLAFYDYLHKMCTTVQGMKALIMDKETLGMTSLCFSASDLTSRDVLLSETIDSLEQNIAEIEKEQDIWQKNQAEAILSKQTLVRTGPSQVAVRMHHLPALVFIQPTQDNLGKLKLILERGIKYIEYHLFFSNAIPPQYLEGISFSDSREQVKTVQEYYGDFYAPTRSIFHSNMSCPELYQVRATTTAEEKQVPLHIASTLDKHVRAIAAVCLALKRRPDVRYTAANRQCKYTAQQIMQLMSADSRAFTPATPDPCLLLILDRKNDPVTPLLSQWTYQAMVHQLIGINNNRVDMSKYMQYTGKTLSGAPLHEAKNTEVDKIHELVLNGEEDKWFGQNMYVSYGELAGRIKTLLADFGKKKSGGKAQLNTLEDMQRFVEEFPELKQMSIQVSKHVALSAEVSRQVNDRQLFKVGALEQQLACGKGHIEAVEEMNKLLQDPKIQFDDKLRLVLLYTLRYERHKENQSTQFKEMLRQCTTTHAEAHRIGAVDHIITHFGSDVRKDKGALFGEGMLRALDTLVKGLTGNNSENIYQQHKPLMLEILNKLASKDGLSTESFPYAEGHDATHTKTRYKHVIVYIIGGCTYEEAAAIESLHTKTSIRFILGGSKILNSDLFLREFLPAEYFEQPAVAADPNSPEMTSTPDYV